MDALLKEFKSVAEDPYSRLAQWKKKTGKKIIGCFPMYLPEEIIHAAGMLPVTLLGSDKAVTLADQYAHPYICRLVRGNFDLSLKGELDFLDGVVFSDFCLTVQMISDIWIHHQPSGFYLQLLMPKNMTAPYTQSYLIRQFEILKRSLEELGQKHITEDSIRESISVYNQNRSLLHRLFQLRRVNPGLFRAGDMAAVVAAGMLMPKEEHSRLLSRLLEKAQASPPSSEHKIRLILSGYLCNEPESDVLDLVEDLGAVICDDDFYVGRRYFHVLVDEGLDPMEALARRYVEDVPCPTKFDAKKDWAVYLSNLAREASADGVLMMVSKYCEAHLYDLPSLAKHLSREGVPNLAVETGHGGALGQARTRVEAFLELLER